MDHSLIADQMVGDAAAIGVVGLDKTRLMPLVRTEPLQLKISNWQMQGDNKLKLNLQFNKEAKGYMFKNFEAILVSELPLRHKIIGEIDTRELESKMKNVDWTFSNPDTEDAEYAKAEVIKDLIGELTKDKEGLEVATQLWNNHIPLFAAIKPKAIDDFENRSDLYVKRKYDPDIKVEDIYGQLLEGLSEKLEKLEAQRKAETLDTLDPALYKDVLVFNDDDTTAIKNKLAKNVEEGAIGVVVPGSFPVLGEKDVMFFRDKATPLHYVDSNMKYEDEPEWLTVKEFGEKFKMWQTIIYNQDELHRFIDFKTGQLQSGIDSKMPGGRQPEMEGALQIDKQFEALKYLISQVTHKDRLEKISASWDIHFAHTPLVKPDFLITCIPQMRKRDLFYPLSQLKRMGIEEAFTTDLRERMLNGEPEIQQPFFKAYFNGDKVNAILYWTKSPDTNLYHLNQWDLTINSPLHEKPVAAIFYKNTKERLQGVYKKQDYYYTTYTFAQSKNYLLGRPVFANYENLRGKHLLGFGQLVYSKDGSSYEKLPRQNDFVDLERIATEYQKAIPKFSDENGRKELIASLRRGNCEQVAVKETDGSASRQWITLNTEIKALNICSNYAHGEKPLSPKEQFVKQYISVDYFKELRAALNEVNKEKYGNKNKSDEKKEVVAEDSNTKKKARKYKRQREDGSSKKTTTRKTKTLKP